MSTNILLTGPRGAGKTTAVLRVLGMLRMVTLGGYLTEPVGDPQEPKGHIMRPFGHQARNIAHVNTKGPRVGRFGVDVEAFERYGVAALRAARERAELIVLDEIGRFEAHAPEFVAEIERCLESPTPVVGVLSAHGGPVVERIAARPDVRLVSVEAASRELLPPALMRAVVVETEWVDGFAHRMATGLILAGGEGSRLSLDKGWLEVGGRPIVERVREAVELACMEVLVAGPEEVADRLGLNPAPDVEGAAGPLAAIGGGLVVSLDDRLLACAWDMPFADCALGLHMLMLAEDEGCDAVAPRTEAGPEPLFAVYGQPCREAAADSLLTGGGRPLEVLEDVNTRWVEGPELAVFGDPRVTLMSVNTPEDLERGREIAGGSPLVP